MSHFVPNASVTHYGYLLDQTEVLQVTLTNQNGIEVDVISFGGIITRIATPDRNGQKTNIVLGMDNIAAYEAGNPYYGAIIGRYGNRIANGKFTLNGVAYQLAKNNGANHLHGGLNGFDRKNWELEPFTNENSSGVKLSATSPDGDQGYPGELYMEVTYILTSENTLEMSFAATTDRATIVNMTQHSYFNLAGEGTILNHQLTMFADAITPVDVNLIPTGKFMSVAGTPFDFRKPKAIGKDINLGHEQLVIGRGYDHNYVLKKVGNDELVQAAEVLEPLSGRVLKVYTDQPGVQFYSGNFLDGSTSRNDTPIEGRTGFCLEAQHYPDSPNQAHFPSTVLLPGQQYHNRIVYGFDVAG
ncbi:aldose epimerase family protein [Thalassotalea mangrovi]|uniref:Aldose 1-epimerase n=1 Tax=Thalassotalea mangrovi TaxID=2572245 RepID=A0A4U1B167_9GAMM|nr:aldose epimerase family protein [Thalassotalea mangrovi]TKB43025.1 galactose mutarotase [Thalassotalea mangrovi]